jgi:AcrR family transcriptional regulator
VPTRTRLTRSERRAQIRDQLLDAASVLFARDGIQGTSIERIAAEAGFTRGAVYSNFADKDDLVVTLLDRRVERSVAEVAEIYRQDPEPDQFHRALYLRAQERAATGDEQVLFIEFWLYALRNPHIRPKLATRFEARRDALADLVERQFADLGATPPADPSDMAKVILALDEGLSLHRAVDPDSHPEELFFQTLSDLMEAALALSRERQLRAGGGGSM